MQIGSVQSSVHAGSSPLKAAGLGGTSAKTVVYVDPRDTNQDGIVSPAEITAYELKHPNLNPARAAHATLPGYTHQGLHQQARQPVASHLDLKA